MLNRAFYLLPVHVGGMREIAELCGLELSYNPPGSAGGASCMAQFSGDFEGFAKLGQCLHSGLGSIPEEVCAELYRAEIWRPVP